MKNFTKQEVRDLLNKVIMDEVSFTRMVELLNEMVNERVSERVSEAGKPNFKDGDFVVRIGCIFILHKQIDEECTQYHVLYRKTNGKLHYYNTYYKSGGTDRLRLATEAEKQELLDALAKEGKRWNAEKKCVEDIPEELKKGDLAIFWDEDKRCAALRFYEKLNESEARLQHKDSFGFNWDNAIKFESKEQFERFIKGKK